MRALVTGASSGIGRDMAIYLDKLGFDVVLVSRDKEKLEKVKDELKGKTEIVPMDLSNSENCKELYNKVKDIDILVNNAGFGTFGSFDETDLDKEIDLIDTNVKAMHILAKLYLKDMLQKDKGHILNVASIAGFMPGPLMCAYYASKAYVVRLSEGIREELRKKKSNVKISVLCPGPVDTNFNDVAGVRFKLPSYSSNHVAKYAIDKMLRNKFIIVPGLKIKLVRFLAKISPNNVTSKIVYMMQERKR
ncbi:MAG: SDR family oxidoreductase [Clostridia bacterium]|nr:SDR family oxidoreductase [Clostridia bacterium]MCI9275406.1 SDR family oxidoreductase [Clostridia bacterium]